AFEKDMTSTMDAQRELDGFIKKFPRSEYIPKAKELYQKVSHLLASHEWYVAKFYYDRDLPMGAVLRLRTLLKKYPDAGFDEDAMWLLAQAYVKVSRPDDARKTYENLLEKFPKSSHADAARRGIERLGKVAAKPSGWAYNTGGGDSLRRLITLGREYYRAHDFDAAESCLREVSERHPGLPDVWNMLGVIHHARGRMADAERSFEAAVKLNPGYTEAALNLAVTYNDLGKYREAREVYFRAMQRTRDEPRHLDPFVKGKLANLHADLGAAYAECMLWPEAVREYQNALALCPGVVDLRTRLPQVSRAMG